jgi:potassium-transporting ATPase KdpC subunit
MKELLSHLRAACLATVALTIVLCGLYPLAVFGLAQLFFPHQANGSLVRDSQGQVRGSELLGQQFTSDKFFHSRPSAAGTGYDATASGGSNLGPASQKLRDAIAERVNQYRKENGLSAGEPVPADAVTASGSGLDPHISVRNAEIQANRVAHERNVPREKILQLIASAMEGPQLGVLGETRVNVLKLNLLLER